MLYYYSNIHYTNLNMKLDTNTDAKKDSTQKVTALLRLIIRAIDLHSRFLSKEVGLTVPQLLILQEIRTHKSITLTEVSMRIKSSKATVSGIVDRLKGKGYINHNRNEDDRRKVSLTLTETGKKILTQDLLPIQRQFVEKFEEMSTERQENVLESLETLATLMFESSSAANDLEQWMTRRKRDGSSLH